MLGARTTTTGRRARQKSTGIDRLRHSHHSHDHHDHDIRRSFDGDSAHSRRYSPTHTLSNEPQPEPQLEHRGPTAATDTHRGVAPLSQPAQLRSVADDPDGLIQQQPAGTEMTEMTELLRPPPALPPLARVGAKTPPRRGSGLPRDQVQESRGQTPERARGAADLQAVAAAATPPPSPSSTKESLQKKADARWKIQELFIAIRKSKSKERTGACRKAMTACWQFNFEPQKRKRLLWDLFVLCLVIFSSFWEPFKAAFGDKLPHGNDMMFWEWIIDICFYSDIVLKFFTGVDKGYEVVMDRKQIAIDYVWPGKPGWFIFDLVATVEWDQIVRAIKGGHGDGDTKMIKLCRLIKVARLARMGRLLDSLTTSWTIHTEYIQAIKFVIYVLIVAHILACFFFMVPAVFDDPIGPGCAARDNQLDGVTCYYADSWRTTYELETMPAGTQYVQALYWSLTTMTTIGYGDRGPQSSDEIIFTMVAEVLGLAVFALLLNQISILKEVVGSQNRGHYEQKNQIVGFLKHNDVNRKMIREVVKFLNFKAKGHSGHALKDSEDSCFSNLSRPLRDRIKQQLFAPALKKVRFFGHSPKDVQERDSLRETFDSIDTDGSNSLDPSEIKQLMEKLLKGKGKAVDDDTVGEAMREMQGLSNMDPVGAQDKVVDFDEFQRWWYLKTHGRPKMPKCPEPFLNQIASLMSDNLMPHGEGEMIVGRMHYNEIKPTAAMDDDWGYEYGDEMWLVLNGSVVIMKRPPREYDRVSARFKWNEKNPNDKYASHKFRENPKKLLFSPNPPRWGCVYEVKPAMRTCMVSHEEPSYDKDGKPSYSKDQQKRGVEYRLAELLVVSRAAPVFQVVGELGVTMHLRRNPTHDYGERNSAGVVDVGTWLHERGTLADRKRVPSASNPEHFTEFIKVDAMEFRTGRVIEGYIEQEPSPGTSKQMFTGDPADQPDHRHDCDVHVEDGSVGEAISTCRTVHHEDEEPIFGLAAALSADEFQQVKTQCTTWYVESVSFVDLSYITHDDLLWALEDYWPAVETEVGESDEKGGHFALRRLALMDHGMDDQLAAVNQRNRTASDLWNVVSKQRHSVVHPIKRLRDCSRRFDDIDTRMERLEQTVENSEKEVMKKLEAILQMQEKLDSASRK